MTNEELGQKIRIQRIQRKLNQTELACAVQSSQKHLSRIENGLTSPTFDFLVKICNILGITVDELIKSEAK
jgi:transcriptional regulator with XRE-family HTH domain